MGNCIYTCLPRSQQKQDLEEHNDGKPKKQGRREVFEEEEEKVRDKSQKMNASDGQVLAGKCKELSEAGIKVDGGVVRVKLMLTKEELQWLMMQLNSGNGEKRLENMLEEIQRGRKKQGGSGNGWKPSLESIVEIPECLEMDTSIRF